MPRKRTSKKDSLLYDVVGIGASWGGVDVLSRIVRSLPSDWVLPIVIVQHQHPLSGGALARILSRLTSFPVIDVEDKESILPGHIYLAPANYHLLLDSDRTFGLSIEAAVNFSRPSIDVTFESLVNIYHRRMIGVILTGANDDGAKGASLIRAEGGYVIAQSPETAEAPIMPEAAIASGVDAILAPEEIVPHIMQLQHQRNT